MERARGILIALAVGLFVLAVLLVLPFLEFFLLAVLLVYPLRPIQKRYESRIGPRVTAGALVVGATVAIILPIVWLLRIVLRELRSLVRRLRRGELTFTEFETWIQDVTGEQVDVMETVQTFLRETGIGTFDGALSVFGTITNVLIGVALTMFLLYYFLKDADRFHRWLRATVPLPDHIYDKLRSEVDDVMWAVLASHVFIAVVQGAVAGLGLIVLGVPSAVFWTLVMIFLAVLPIIGSFLVWGPAAIYLFSTGQPISGSLLLVYGAIVVSFCDDYLRPVVIDRHTTTRLNPSAIILGVLGGVYLLGFIGIFFGPVIIGLLRAVLDVYRREYVEEGPEETIDDQPVTDEEAVTEGSVAQVTGGDQHPEPNAYDTASGEE